ncbi:DEAD/DEAH box helicase [Shumkonia mesophila]|uniref:DEAD/DEAH box helicase n=1 Tax=Shumkonia mesophila TaxID=2838854 RepID=UPI002934AE7F|nr:DEAD/DEAH box helicase [Shumkonia mesophila]
MTFAELGLSEDVLRAVADAGYVEPTPIQQQAIPVVLMGRDVLGCAQTGTGKTAGFTLPMIEILAAGRAKARMPRSLILEPTRELAAQVAEAFEVYGKYHKLNKALLIGGESMGDQTRVLDRGVDVLIATPGRLLDMFERGKLLLNDVKILVIDEADRMLDMGFIPDVEKIVSLVSKMRQTLFFSATMPPEIRRLADAFLSNPKTITVSPPSTPAATVTQGLCMVSAPHGAKPGSGAKDKRAALRRLIESEEVRSALVFCNRKREVSVVWRSLVRHGYSAGQLHGDMSQPARTETLAAFKRGEIRLLVCSDVAARGLDVQDMSHVFNFDVPTHAEDYIHRIGRTGRAGREGRAFTIALPEERKYLAAITRMLGRDIPRIDLTTTADAPAPAETQATEAPAETSAEAAAEPRGRRRRHRSDDHRAARQPDRQPDRQPEPRPAVETVPDEPAPAAPPPIRAEVRAEPRKQPQRRGRRQDGDSRDDDRPVRGLGDHVPAFLLRAVTPPPPRPEDDVEDIDDVDDVAPEIEDVEAKIEDVEDVEDVKADSEEPAKAPAKPRTRARAAAKPRGRRAAKAPAKKREAKEG